MTRRKTVACQVDTPTPTIVAKLDSLPMSVRDNAFFLQINFPGFLPRKYDEL